MLQRNQFAALLVFPVDNASLPTYTIFDTEYLLVFLSLATINYQVEERRKLGLVRFSLAMDDMRRLVDQAGFAEHEDSDVDEEADSARVKAGGKAAKVCGHS